MKKLLAVVSLIAFAGAVNAQLKISQGGTSVTTAPSYNVKANGLVCNGSTDDTAKWNAMVATINAGNVGASIDVPAGSNCYLAGPTTAITVSAELYGNGPCANDPSKGCISEISYGGTTTDAIKITGVSASVHDIGFVNVSGTTPSAGAAINFCPPSANIDATFHVFHTSFYHFFNGVNSCQSEGASISENYFNVYNDAILMAGESPYNGGDFTIQGNVAFTPANYGRAFVELAGQGAGRIVNNKAVQGGGGTYDYGVLCSSTAGSAGCFNLIITGNDFENIHQTTISLNATPTLNTYINIDGNQLLQDFAGPIIDLNGASHAHIGGNVVENQSTTPMPEVVLVRGGSYGTTIDPQAGPIGPTTTGTINSGTAALTVADAHYFSSGNPILVVGAGTAGVDLATTVSSVLGSVVTLATNASTSVTDAQVNGPNTIVRTQVGLSNGQKGPYYSSDNSLPLSSGGDAVLSSITAPAALSGLVLGPKPVYFSPGGVSTIIAATNMFRPIADNTVTDGLAGLAWTGTYTYRVCFETGTASYSSCLSASGVTANRTWAWPDASGTVGVIPTASTGHAVCETTSHTLGHCSSVVASDGTCTCS